MLTAIPATIRAGDTLSITLDTPETPAPTWAATLTLINGASKVQFSSSASGSQHLLARTAAQTAAWAAARYGWSLHVVAGAERRTLASGSIDVLPDLAAATTLDTRTAAAKALEAAESALATYGAKAYLQTIQLGDRTQTFRSPGDFLSWISKLRAQVRSEADAERVARGLAPRNRLLVRFR